MNQLLLSSQRLSNQKVLATGSLDVFQTLGKNETSSIDLTAAAPKGKLELEWKEVATPATSTGFRDLVGKKMAAYKFQYIGQFKYDGQPVSVESEVFASALEDKTIQNQNIESDGWVNCTWLIDFLMNGATKTDEKLMWSEEEGNLVLTISTQDAWGKHAEQQKITFSSCLSRLEWGHYILFSGQ